MKIHCSVEECIDKVQAKGFCHKHYIRNHKYGDPLVTKLRKRNMSDEELLSWMRTQVKKNLETGCHEWRGAINKAGYGIVLYKGKSTLVHRLIWFFNYDYWPKKFLLHSCDTPRCINLDHLREGSQKDNMNDMVNRGRQAKGESHYKTNLTEEQVIMIRKLWKTGRYLQKDLARRFGVGHVAISTICSRTNWKHIL